MFYAPAATVSQTSECLYRSIAAVQALGAGMTLVEQVCHRPEAGSIETWDGLADAEFEGCTDGTDNGSGLSDGEILSVNDNYAVRGHIGCPRARVSFANQSPLNAADYRGSLLPSATKTAQVCGYTCGDPVPGFHANDACEALSAGKPEIVCAPPPDWWCR